MAIKAAIVLVLLPFVLIAACIAVAVAFVAVFLALLIPFLPIAFLVFCVWAVIRVASPPAYAR